MATGDEPAHRRELGGFLRAHRELVTPEQVGLPRSPRRRTPGLRREEVAALSGVGVAWYTWLEQGRVDTSRQVLEAVSRALRLDADAHRHVLELAGFHVAAPSDPTPTDALRAMIEGWPTSPAVLLDRNLDILGRNGAWSALWPDPDPDPGPDPDPASGPDSAVEWGPDPTSADRRNLLLMFLTAGQKHEPPFPDRESVALDLVRHLRTRPEDARGRALAAHLRAGRPDLAAWWACRSVGAFTPRTVEGRTRAGEGLRFGLSLLAPAGAAETAVLVCTPGDAATVAYVERAGRVSGARFVQKDDRQVGDLLSDATDDGPVPGGRERRVGDGGVVVLVGPVGDEKRRLVE
ncbi:helix-turn-helix domain-containing protein [Streptomyces sp. SID3343]|uniref:helix-turn-helix domain-containing protein n=1 Tax=Streptomyces sp. SID3343 TaxID=2690260 RepID=UPI001F288E6B|nr:helix-turn-helix domain-containing protein [Streptomyces sp. SID3343]